MRLLEITPLIHLCHTNASFLREVKTGNKVMILWKWHGCNQFKILGSEFDEVFVGVGARRIRQLFEVAKLAAPSIIFIDEIDSIGMSRSKLHCYLKFMIWFKQN